MMAGRAIAGRRDWLTGAILLAALGFLAAGLSLPAVSVRTLIFTERYSLLDAVVAFAADGRWFLFLIVGAFTVVTPTLKILVAVWLWLRGSVRRGLDRTVAALLEGISRWSMLDVFVVALTVLLLDGRLLTSADVGLGVVLFAGAVILSAWAARRLLRTVSLRPASASN